MSNYERTLKSCILDSEEVSGLSAEEFRFYVYIHCGSETSDTSIFYYPLRRVAFDCRVSEERAKELIDSFMEKGLCEYDFGTSEILVTDYFNHNKPKNTGVCYKMYEKDFAKIKSKVLLQSLADRCRDIETTVCFISAMATVLPELEPGDFQTKGTSETIESVRTAAERGRKRVGKKAQSMTFRCYLDVKSAIEKGETNRQELLTKIILDEEYGAIAPNIAEEIVDKALSECAISSGMFFKNDEYDNSDELPF